MMRFDIHREARDAPARLRCSMSLAEHEALLARHTLAKFPASPIGQLEDYYWRLLANETDEGERGICRVLARTAQALRCAAGEPP